MISLDSKTHTSNSSQSSPLSLSAKGEDDAKGTLSFSQLLKGVGAKKDEKVIQNGAIVLALADEKDVKTTKNVKHDTLISLLKNDDIDDDIELDIAELNPKLRVSMTPDELKALIKDAKNYLKDKIISSEGFKKSEIEALPKTLKGLTEVAKKFGINISKISFEEVKVDVKAVTKNDVKLETSKTNRDVKQESVQVNKEIKVTLNSAKEVKQEKAQATQEVKQETALTNKDVKLEAAQIKREIKQEVSVQAHKEVKHEMPHQVHKEVKQEAPQVINERSLDLKEEPITNKKEVLSSELNGDNKPKSTSKHSKKQVTSQSTQDVDDNVKFAQEVKTEKFIKEVPKEIKSTPLFKAQVNIEITTEQLVNAKITTTEVKPQKQKADETLQMLLRGEKVTKNDLGHTADFSVATARVIAPTAKTEASKSLESLLRGEQSEHATNSKMDGFNVSKADSFEVKLHEAKQMVKYLSQDVKTAIEDYKAPFTRVKVQLNPQRLGEIDLTVVQRGKNLHISLSSNNAAINALSMNASDLKLQLSNNGINNATLNFNNSGSQGSETAFSGGQQQNSQNERRAREEYGFFENEETNEEILSSLEIIVPNYA